MDVTVVTLYDFLAYGEPDPRPFELRSAMQPLKNEKDALAVAFVEADPVVANFDDGKSNAGAVLDPSGDLDLRDDVGSAEFQGIANEILKELSHLRLVDLHERERVDSYDRPGLFHEQLESR